MDNDFPRLNDTERAEFSRLLHNTFKSEQQMPLDMLDGYLHAIAIGPTTISPWQWLPALWGFTEGLPPQTSTGRLERLIDLLMKHYNSIIYGLERTPARVSPIWPTCEYRGRSYPVASGWARGFFLGIGLSQDDWLPMLESDAGLRWYRPLALLCSEYLDDGSLGAQFSELTRTPARRAKLAEKIPDAILAMFAYWIPHRQIVAEREAIARSQAGGERSTTH